MFIQSSTWLHGPESAPAEHLSSRRMMSGCTGRHVGATDRRAEVGTHQRDRSVAMPSPTWRRYVTSCPGGSRRLRGQHLSTASRCRHCAGGRLSPVTQESRPQRLRAEIAVSAIVRAAPGRHRPTQRQSRLEFVQARGHQSRVVAGRSVSRPDLSTMARRLLIRSPRRRQTVRLDRRSGNDGRRHHARKPIRQRRKHFRSRSLVPEPAIAVAHQLLNRPTCRSCRTPRCRARIVSSGTLMNLTALPSGQPSWR